MLAMAAYAWQQHGKRTLALQTVKR
jgi:hypothetical protein